MKPKFIFSAVFAVCILMGSFLPRIASPRAAAAALPAAAARAAQAARANAHSTVPATVPGLVMESLPTAAPTTSPTLEPTAVPPSPTPEAGPIPVGVPADPAALEQAAPASPAVQPDLAGFAASITNGQVDTVVGIYIDGLFSLPVLQQPPGDDAYVSNDNHAVTQYAWPSKYGTIALLAHNTLSGRIFFQINANQDIILIFGDGRMEHYRMKEVQNYQALSPTTRTPILWTLTVQGKPSSPTRSCSSASTPPPASWCCKPASKPTATLPGDACSSSPNQ